jgi:hypothetical protein|eukprot:COSAG01_NODE_1430_length_10325_cov_7.452376_9_plen_441_part_00
MVGCPNNDSICFPYEDGSFPPTASSIGSWKGKSPKEIEEEFEWRRGGEMFAVGAKDGDDKSGDAKLFSGKIEPGDIGQGQLGDCWLMTALACLAEFPGAIQAVFKTAQYNPRGRYCLRLFNGQTEEWENVVVDDYIPCKKGTNKPIFAQPHGNELWVMLLEKAFAKFVKGYDTLDGGFSLWGLQTLTGDVVSNWSRETNGRWGEYEIRYKEGGKGGVQDIGFYKVLSNADKQGGRRLPHTVSGDEFFDQLARWDSEECVIAASTSGTDEGEATAQHGLVKGHAYAVVTVIHCGKYQMLRLRNPWGKFEWDGDWSDASPLWKQHPDVRNKCPGGGEEADDGFFWMEFKDFETHFGQVDVCHRSTGISDVRLDVNEDMGCAGPIAGCVCGCCKFYVCCVGGKALCCPARHSVQAEKKKKEQQNARVKGSKYTKIDESMEVLP